MNMFGSTDSCMVHPQENLQSQLIPVKEEEEVGVARVIEVFRLTGTKQATIGGCVVESGKLVRGEKTSIYRVLRHDQVRTSCTWL